MTWTTRCGIALALVVLLSGAAPRVNASPTDEAPALVSLVASLQVVDLTQTDDGSGAQVTRGPLAGAEVRLFAATQHQAAEDIVARFEREQPVASCVVDKDGQCQLPVPAEGKYEAILRWRDPTASQTVYTVRTVQAGDANTKTVDTKMQIIELILPNGQVQWSSGHKIVVTG